MSLKIAVAGKGGTGKSTLSALLIRALLNGGKTPLLAVDADPNSCLHEKLGVQVGTTIGDLREELREASDQMPAGMAKSQWIEQVLSQEMVESKGFDLVTMGRQEGAGCYCFINNLLRECLERLGRQYAAVVIDNEAGLEHLSRRSNGDVDVLLVISQPTVIGARTARRIFDMVDHLKLAVGQSHLLLNGADGDLPEAVSRSLQDYALPPPVMIPQDPEILDFEARECSLLELPDESPAASAVQQFVTGIL